MRIDNAGWHAGVDDLVDGVVGANESPSSRRAERGRLERQMEDRRIFEHMTLATSGKDQLHLFAGQWMASAGDLSTPSLWPSNRTSGEDRLLRGTVEGASRKADGPNKVVLTVSPPPSTTLCQ